MGVAENLVLVTKAIIDRLKSTGDVCNLPNKRQHGGHVPDCEGRQDLGIGATEIGARLP